MHINEKSSPEDVQILEYQNTLASEPGARIVSKSCPESIAREESSGSFMNKDFPPNQIEVNVQKKCFASHWSVEAVNEALEVSLAHSYV